MFDDYLRVPINVSRDQGEQATSVIYSCHSLLANNLSSDLPRKTSRIAGVRVQCSYIHS